MLGVFAVAFSACGTVENVLPIAPAKGEGVVLFSPLPHDVVASPFVLEGEARGMWFFEASLPILLTDAEGNRIAESYATAQGEWMTTDFVPFRATLSFATDAAEGYLLIRKDNPSGLSENDGELKVPVRFK